MGVGGGFRVQASGVRHLKMYLLCDFSGVFCHCHCATLTLRHCHVSQLSGRVLSSALLNTFLAIAASSFSIWKLLLILGWLEFQLSNEIDGLASLARNRAVYRGQSFLPIVWQAATQLRSPDMADTRVRSHEGLEAFVCLCARVHVHTCFSFPYLQCTSIMPCIYQNRSLNRSR